MRGCWQEHSCSPRSAFSPALTSMAWMKGLVLAHCSALKKAVMETSPWMTRWSTTTTGGEASITVHVTESV